MSQPWENLKDAERIRQRKTTTLAAITKLVEASLRKENQMTRKNTMCSTTKNKKYAIK
jgi:hypothetical protein